MIALLRRWFGHDEAALAEARPRDAAALSALHAKSFQRGWSEAEFERLLLDRSVLVDRASFAHRLAGFIMSRRAANEAEILSVAVAAARRRRGLAGRLLALHLRKLAGLGVRRVFLEVDEGNPAARRLYQRAGFRTVGRRAEYYQQGVAGGRAVALVLRRDLA
jgi:[ribosomal protein S18]-alanine N-acetyltransferase